MVQKAFMSAPGHHGNPFFSRQLAVHFDYPLSHLPFDWPMDSSKLPQMRVCKCSCYAAPFQKINVQFLCFHRALFEAFEY